MGAGKTDMRIEDFQFFGGLKTDQQITRFSIFRIAIQNTPGSAILDVDFCLKNGKPAGRAIIRAIGVE